MPDLTIAEAAAQFAVHPATIRRAIADGRIKAYRVGRGRLIRIKVEDLAGFARPLATATAR